MALIGLFGPHAVGKTTAARRLVVRYPGLVVALCDLQLEVVQNLGCPLTEMRVREWKLTLEDKERMIALHQQRVGVTLMESIRPPTPNVKLFGPDYAVVILTCDEANGRKWLEARRGKPLTDYWSKDRLDYECKGRFVNWADKFPPGAVKHFHIQDQARDWPAVDAHLGKLYRRLWNQVNPG